MRTQQGFTGDKNIVSAASHPPLQKAQGRGTQSSGTGRDNTEGWATRPLVIFIVLRQLLIPALVLGMVLPVRIVRIVNLGTNLVVGANGKLHGVTGSQHAKEDYEPPEMVFTDEMS
jgi:hypothetical protein